MNLLKEISFVFITSLKEFEDFNKNNILERSNYIEEITVPLYYTFEGNLRIPLKEKNNQYILSIFLFLKIIIKKKDLMKKKLLKILLKRSAKLKVKLKKES